MKKPKPFDVEFQTKLCLAYREAKAAAAGQTVAQAKAAFLEHWGRAVIAIETMLAAGGEPMRELGGRIDYVLQLVRPLMRDNPYAGEFVFEAAQRMARDLVALAREQPPPAWLVERAAMEYEVPWLMVNGKPAPGFDEADAALAWGRTFTKRSKNGKRSHNDFDAPQSRDVAAALHHTNYMRKHYRDIPGFLETCCRVWRKHKDEPGMLAIVRQTAALPPLSRKSAAQWWPVVRAFVRRNATLTESEKRSIRASLDYDTPAALMNEYLKRCKLAFEGLCPADAPGEESPESYPIDSPAIVRPCPPTKGKKGARDNESARTGITEKLLAGRGDKPRRSPRNHGGRHRGGKDTRR